MHGLAKLILFMCFPALTLVAAVRVGAVEQVGDAEWKARMQLMLTDVTQLIPFAFSASKNLDPKEQVEIEKALNSLSKHSSELRNHTTRLSRTAGLKIDPSFPFIAEAFESEISLALASFQQNEKGAIPSQTYLRSAIGKCAACHSQSLNGPELKLTHFNARLNELPGLDRVTALAATRQFEEALSSFLNFARASKVKKPDEASFDLGARLSLAIAVRVQRDPKRALALVETIAESGSGSPLLQHDLTSWRKEILQWLRSPEAKRSSEQALFDNAQRLVSSARTRASILESNENSDVSFLRASADLHDLLSQYPQSPHRAKSYLLISSIYDSLPGFALWDLSDEYLGACVEENPHSEIGETCFKKYRDSVSAGFTGSAGVHIPSGMQEHIEKMRVQATRRHGS